MFFLILYNINKKKENKKRVYRIRQYLYDNKLRPDIFYLFNYLKYIDDKFFFRENNNNIIIKVFIFKKENYLIYKNNDLYLATVMKKLN